MSEEGGRRATPPPQPPPPAPREISRDWGLVLTLLLLGQQPGNRAGPGSPWGEPEGTNAVAIALGWEVE